MTGEKRCFDPARSQRLWYLSSRTSSANCK